MNKINIIKSLVIFISILLSFTCTDAAMNDYCVVPPFITPSVPPLVMLNVDRSHKLFYQAYNDATDLSGDGRLDITYNHSVDYYGYFDPYKCYTYTSNQFNPAATTTTKFCSSGQWSGNVLNWLSMSRIDTLRKVLYGGHRQTDTTSSTVLERTYLPMDAHSWGKEMTGRLCNSGTTYTRNCSLSSECDTGYTCVDVAGSGNYLIPYAAATAPDVCTAQPVTGAQSGKVLVARYRHSSSKNCGTSTSSGLISSYEPFNLFAAPNLVTYVNGFDDSSLDPSTDHYGSDYNILALTTFTAPSGTTGTWSFAVDGDDDAEVQVGPQGQPGTVVAQFLGCHAYSNGQSNNGTYVITAGQKYTIVARQFEKGGSEGVRVWYKTPGSSTWKYVNSTNMTLEAPDIASGNECAVETTDFITTGVPSTGVVQKSAGSQHLFCNTSLSDGGSPLLRFIQNVTNRIWAWSSKERPVCNDTSHNPNNDYPFGSTNPTDFTVRVKVCDTTMKEPNCRAYNDSSGTSTYKPAGLLQKYGEGDGSKVCSKSYTKTCSTATTDSSDCGTGEGLCVYKSPMYFGMISGTYEKNHSGGVLRKNLSTMLDEITTTTGIFNSSVHGIVNTFENLKLVGYDFSSYSYSSNCGWYETGPIPEGQCSNWGNPIAEMLYETLRYFAGKGTATSDFTYSATTDGGLSLPKPSWGFTKGSTTYQPYEVYPSCSRPFALILSDINPNYDSDQIPGSSFKKPDNTSFSEDSATPQLGLGVQTNGVSLLNSLVNTIGTNESMANKSWFIGQSGSASDTLCTSKSVSNLSTIRGLCPEEPTKQGNYYSAALAYYGNTLFKTKTSKPNMTTYAVALSSPVAELKIKAGANYITLVPTGKSVSGGLSVYQSCALKCPNLAYDVNANGLTFGDNCSADVFCPTNQIVNFWMNDVRYNSSNDVIYAQFRINFEDSEQGADHDMDTIVKYEVCTQTAKDAKYGSCTTDLGSNIQVKINTEYGAGSIDQALGFTISGTTADGVYLPVKDGDVPDSASGTTPAVVAAMPKTWSKTFTPIGGASDFMKDPLWYAAKWGGFSDSNGSGLPDLQSKWDTDSDGIPDNYFLVVNPLKLDQQLDKAFSSILNRATAGTAAAVANNRSGERGANVIQAIFYPQWPRDKNIQWLGDVQALWFYLDPLVRYSGVYEDTDQNKKLNLDLDRIPNADSLSVNAIWKAGDLLLSRADSTRSIYTLLGSSPDLTATTNSFMTGIPANLTALKPLLDMSSATDTATNAIINYVRGVDSSSQRSRTLTYNSVTGTWKLGDIINSTPQIQSSQAMNSYATDYNDSSYEQFTNSNQYKTNNFVYVGANDGMLHAFRLGLVATLSTTNIFELAQIVDTTNLGKEEWAFIPKNVLPYLKYCADMSYCHQYLVDGTPLVFDASINKHSDCTASNYWDCPRKTTLSTTKDVDFTKTSWQSFLLGSMGHGGATRDGNCNETLDPDTVATNNSDCIKTPVAGIGYSSYFALDITTPLTPKFMWEFSDGSLPAADRGLGLSTPGPAIVRINSKDGTTHAIDKTTNGRWFAVIPSGPTGPIDKVFRQMKGRSDQNLKIYVLDINPFNSSTTSFVKCTAAGQTNCNYWVKDTGIKYAFAHSSYKSQIDLDQADSRLDGYYSDDVVYIGYTKATLSTSGTSAGYPTVWDKGGILRLITNNDPDPSNWFVSTLIDDIGPITASVDILQSRGNSKLWVFFGEGRYFYPGDDLNTQRRIFGVADPCYRSDQGHANTFYTTSATCPAVTVAQLKDQTSTPAAPLTTEKGWYLNLTAAAGLSGSERIYGKQNANTNGVVFYTTLTPSSDICIAGGLTSQWSVKYNTGGTPPKSGLQGQLVATTTDSPIPKMINLVGAFTRSGGRQLDAGIILSGAAGGGGGGVGGSGFMVKNPTPVKRMINIQER